MELTFLKSIIENVSVIDRQFKELGLIREKLSILAPHLLQDFGRTGGIDIIEKNETNISSEDAVQEGATENIEEGVYL